MKENDAFLLNSPAAERLYFDYAAGLPVIDWHCHISAKEIAENKRYADLFELMLAGDHYKWRLMRMCGVPERLITGDAEPFDKFRAFASVLPLCVGNPVYEWTHLELRRFFDCELPLSSGAAAEIWRHCNDKMPTPQELLAQTNTECIITTDNAGDDLEYHGIYGVTTVLPGLRVDSDAGAALADADRFARYGCVSADITDLKIAGSLAPELARRGWTMLLHLDPLRNVNSAAFGQIGVNAGFDAMGGGVDITELAKFLDGLYGAGSLPRSIIFSINPNDSPALNALCGAFPQVFQGPAWWFNDTFDGIRAQLKSYAAVNAVGTHPGMVTDSRSFLSYSRHEYFRRIFCDFLAEAAIRGRADFDTLGAIVRCVCYENAKQIIKKEKIKC